MKYSYDYTDLIEKLDSDLKEGLIKSSDKLKIVRSDKVVYNNYKPIIDYYYYYCECKETYSVMIVKDVIEEMKEENSII